MGARLGSPLVQLPVQLKEEGCPASLPRTAGPDEAERDPFPPAAPSSLPRAATSIAQPRSSEWS